MTNARELEERDENHSRDEIIQQKHDSRVGNGSLIDAAEGKPRLSGLGRIQSIDCLDWTRTGDRIPQRLVAVWRYLYLSCSIDVHRTSGNKFTSTRELQTQRNAEQVSVNGSGMVPVDNEAHGGTIPGCLP